MIYSIKLIVKEVLNEYKNQTASVNKIDDGNYQQIIKIDSDKDKRSLLEITDTFARDRRVNKVSSF